MLRPFQKYRPDSEPLATSTIRHVHYPVAIAVGSQIWLAHHVGNVKTNGLDPKFVQSTTGLLLFQAKIGGSIEKLATAR